MSSVGFDVVSLLVACGGLFACALGLAGMALLLVKLGVIGSYWLKGEESVQDGGDYNLNQSKDIS